MTEEAASYLCAASFDFLPRPTRLRETRSMLRGASMLADRDTRDGDLLWLRHRTRPRFHLLVRKCVGPFGMHSLHQLNDLPPCFASSRLVMELRRKHRFCSARASRTASQCELRGMLKQALQKSASVLLMFSDRLGLGLVQMR